MALNDSLKSLHTALVDAGKGYVTAFKDADTPRVKSMFQEMMSLHQNAHAELHKTLHRLGVPVDEDGSFMTAVHKAVISVRAATVGLDQNSISSFVDGEERIVEHYDKAIADAVGDVEALAILKRQRAALANKISDMTRLAA
jgi:uncharacterized protein (TIGR02284 family)